MPGTSALEAARVVAGELPDLIHVVELPERGPGADMVGRAGALLVSVSSSLGMDTTPDGWRFAAGGGRYMRRAQSFLGEDLDALEQTAADYRGPVKCQVAGPWTIAASVELPSGERALRDPAATWDIAQALAEALGAHIGDVRRRVPGATAILVQVDEPGLPAVLAGRVGTASGLSSYAPVDPQEATRCLATVLAAVQEADALGGVHCCASGAPLALLRAAGARFVSVDVSLLDPRQDEEVGQAWEAGVGLMAGTVPSTGTGAPSDVVASAPLRALMGRLGIVDERAIASLAVTPTCGLARATPAWARIALASCASVGRVVRHDDVVPTHEGAGHG